VIVGAGISGLSAYRELKRYAPFKSVVILEATNRIGGRMKMGYFTDKNQRNITIELGSNWLHNSDTTFGSLAMASKLQTSKTNYLKINIFDETGVNITSLYRTVYNQFTDSQTGPFYRMLNAAYQYWNEINDQYTGTENIMQLMKDKFAYVEDTELKAFVRWLLIDYEYIFNNIALLNYQGPEVDMIDPNEFEQMVIDPRGFETVLQKFASDYSIEPRLNTRVSLGTDISFFASNRNLKHK
jgi:NAD(P)-binding Rossmann-like domain